MIRPPSGRVAAILAALGACFLWACSGMSLQQRTSQGLAGTFLTYGPAPQAADCASLPTHEKTDSCRRENLRTVEEPYRSVIVIRNLGTRESVSRTLDDDGSYRILLVPGEYEVCLDGECSDPLEVRLGKFTTYGQRLPRRAAALKKVP